MKPFSKYSIDFLEAWTHEGMNASETPRRFLDVFEKPGARTT